MDACVRLLGTLIHRSSFKLVKPIWFCVFGFCLTITGQRFSESGFCLARTGYSFVISGSGYKKRICFFQNLDTVSYDPYPFEA